MANYRSIHVRTWKDPDFVELSMEGKLIFLYLLLNEEVTTSGIYPISPITISNETGIPLPTVGDTLGKGLPNVGYDQKTKTVFIKNHLKYDKGGSLENCIIAIANDCKFIKSPFWADFVNLYPTHAKGLPNPLPYSTPTPTPTSTPTSTLTPTSLGIDESKKQDSSCSIFDYRMTIRLRRHVESYKSTKPKTKIQLKKWVNIFRLMRKEDKVKPCDIRRWLLWAINDEFWRGNILSAAKFRQRVQEGKIQAAIAREVEWRNRSGEPSEAVQERDEVVTKRQRADARKAREETEAVKREADRLAKRRETDPVEWAKLVVGKKVDTSEVGLRKLLKSQFVIGFYREAVKILLEETIK